MICTAPNKTDNVFDNIQSVLIHSAAGGVGIAAIQIAQMVGAEVSKVTSSLFAFEFISS